MTTTQPARDALAGMIGLRAASIRRAQEAEAEARRLAAAAHEATGNRDAAYLATKRHAGDAHDLIRALVNADESEPPAFAYVEEYGGRRADARATFAHVWLSKYTRATAPKWHASGQVTYTGDARTTVALYEPDRGTNDPAKLGIQMVAAEEAGRAFLAQHTAGAWLAARGIAPSDPADLLRVVMDPDIGTDSGRVHLSARWQIVATVPGLEPFPLLDRPVSSWHVQREPRTDPWRDEPGAWWSCSTAEWRERPQFGSRFDTDPADFDPRAYYPAEVVAFHDRHAPDVLAWYLASLRRSAD